MNFRVPVRAQMLPVVAVANSENVYERQAAVGAFLKAQGIIHPGYSLRYDDIGFQPDSAAGTAISCRAIFMELIRSRIRPDQLAYILNRYAGSRLAKGMPVGYYPEPFSEVYAPLEADSTIMVFVRNVVPSQRRAFRNSYSGFLVVLHREGDILYLLEQTPLCRLREPEEDDRPKK